MNATLRRWSPYAAAALAVLLYINILSNTFIWDDWQQIFENSFLRSPAGIAKIFSTNVWGFQGQVTNYYRPLMHLTFYVALRAFGFNPAGYHIISIALHALISALVFFLIRRWSGDSLIALFSSLLFAAHPIHTENVCWISGYPDLEATLFVLLALLIYTIPRHSDWRILGGVGVAACFFLGLLSKETAIVIPVLCFAWDYFELRDIPAILRERLSEYSAMGIALIAYGALRWRALGGIAPFSQMHDLPPGVQVLTRLALVYRYIEKCVAPVQLTAFHLFPPSYSLFDWRVLAGIALLGLSLWLAIALWRARRPEVLALVIFAAALAPAFSLPYGSFNLLGERYLYLPSVGFCWLLGWRLSTSKRWGAWILLAVLGAYALRTEARNLDWRSEIPFYKKTIAMAPAIAELHVLLGEAYMRREMLPEALAETRLAASLKPNYAEAANNLGQIYSRMGNHQQAAAEYTLAIRYAQRVGVGYGIARAYNNLAYELSQMGHTGDAILTYRKSIEINPEFSGAYNNLGDLYMQQGQYAAAEENLLHALKLEPTFLNAASNLGLLYTLTGNYDRAERFLSEALRLGPGSGETYARLGDLAYAKGNREQAKEYYRKALELHPENKRAAEGIGRR